MESKTIRSLTGRSLKITNPGNTYIHLDFTDNRPERAYGNFSRAELIAALAAVGVKGDEFPKEPTPGELREAEIAKLEALPFGTVVERRTQSGIERLFFKAGGKFTREDTGRSYHATEITSMGDMFTVKYPKED